MPSLKIARTNEYGRLDKAVAQMILAKIYLNAEVYIGSPKYAECATQCSNIIASGYVINPNYLNNFKADNETSSEMIFTLQADGRVTQNYGATTVMCNGSVGSLEQNGASIGVSAGGWGGAIRLRKQLVEKFSNSTSFPSDTRNTILGAGRNIEIADLSIQKQGFILRKYSNIKSNGVNGVDATFVDTDFPLFRLSDVYLMYAECAFRGASTATTAQAVIYINEIRDKRGGTVGNRITTGGLTASFLIDERARELHWEAHRRQDLIRFGLYTGGIYNWAWKGNGSVGVSLDSNFKLFPIPENSISANNNLTQNPGYQN